MRGTFGSRLSAGAVVLTMAAAACGYDGGNNSGYGATAPGSGYPAALEADQAGAHVIRASGDLTAALAEFRSRLGDPLNRAAGEQSTGRREINWDGVSGALVNVDTFPADFFNRVVPRGEIYATDGTGFRVSDNALSDLNLSYAGQFGAFSPTKIFIPVGRPLMSVHFVVAGALTPARVNGFGVVFSDVDVEGSATLAFFDARDRLLTKVTAPVRSDKAGFSFVGVTFDNPIVAKVRILSGTAAITGRNLDISDGGEADLVAMDDFISGEPHAAR
jgi:hypothetical protein